MALYIEVTTDTNYIYPYPFIKYKLNLYVYSDTSSSPTGLTANSSASWINVKKSDTNLRQLVFELSENAGFVERSGTITLTATGAGTATKTLTITQKGYEFYPIWKTTNYEYPTFNNYVEYKITSGGDTIFAGRAYKLPTKDTININLNEICSNSLSSEINNAFKNGNIYQFVDAYKRFNLYLNDDIITAYNFYNSYSYNDLSVNSANCVNLSFPINNVIDTRQYFVNSFFYPLVKGGTSFEYLRYSLDADRGSNYSNSFNVTTNQQCVITDKNINNAGTLTVYYNGLNLTGDTMIYKVKNTCCKYCLYYINACGGWDSFLINGNDIKEDKYTSSSILKYVNNTTSNFENKPYLNEIDVEYTLYTHYLTDDEASRMHHLLESNTVYLHNLEEDTVVPVIITNKSCKYKTFANEGKKKFYYTINVKESLKKIRK